MATDGTATALSDGWRASDLRGVVASLPAVRSVHADTFNHDLEAAGYDDDVVDESNPIRAGYAATLDWVVERAAVGAEDQVVDLGIGTANLAVRLPSYRRLVGVDVSEQMLGLAAAKLHGTPGVELVRADLLEFLDRPGTFDAIVSTYAIHHLVADEKALLIEHAAARLAPGGRLVVGDLMASSRAAVDRVKARLQHPDADDFFVEEFPWFLDDTLAGLDRAGFTGVAVEQFSELSWGVAARRR
jgi:putative AdoMet-dependent methyltransferase